MTGTLWYQTYTYDRYGNRTNVTASGTAADSSAIPLDGTPNLTYDNDTNRITTSGYTYDVAGNQTKGYAADGTTSLTYEYDAANRISVIKKTSDGSYVQAFQYGSTNARLIDWDGPTGQNSFYCSVGGTVMAEYIEYSQNNPTWTKSYTYLGDTQLATITPSSGSEVVEFNHPDRLGTRLKTNQSAGTSVEQAHLPFGTALNAESTVTNNNKRFTSYDRSPSTGLDYAVNRTYDNKLGRFTQVDPIGMQAVSLTVPQSLNLFSYCGNDPINYVDPSGLFIGSFFRWLGRVIMSLFRSGVARRIAVRFVVSYVVSGGNLGVAFRSVLPDILRHLGLNPSPLLTPSWNPNLRHPISFGISGLSKYIIQNILSAVKSRFPCPPSISQLITRFGRFLVNLLEKESGHQTDSPLENGGWIYQRSNGDLFFLRVEKFGGEWRRGRARIDFSNPPHIRGARVVGRAHTHPYTPYEQDLINAGRASGGPSPEDTDNSTSLRMPSLVAHQYGVDPTDNRRLIAVDPAAPGVERIYDNNCSGGTR